ncbi:hypothetical protein BN77_p260010 [Rhizobium mesoamericanum STM3625]|uniref:Uncharacterized protein n=1 Tax=Rhizobium mesoamericanum STM3625 TaxID=1211777 RepID=K0Q1M0_9HYPH|nr:hypothetical protein BN77_p260010 [Rhizobium mesoamericanum STM3625]
MQPKLQHFCKIHVGILKIRIKGSYEYAQTEVLRFALDNQGFVMTHVPARSVDGVEPLSALNLCAKRASHSAESMRYRRF